MSIDKTFKPNKPKANLNHTEIPEGPASRLNILRWPSQSLESNLVKKKPKKKPVIWLEEGSPCECKHKAPWNVLHGGWSMVSLHVPLTLVDITGRVFFPEKSLPNINCRSADNIHSRIFQGVVGFSTLLQDSTNL